MLEHLPIDMVEDFVTSDDLHLLHLGIMKKCLLMWRDGVNNFEFKWTDDDVASMNEMLRNINLDMPTDIHRSVRSIDYLTFWKGTELRTFLLYVGVVVLRHVLRSDEYKHFMKLLCAVTICSTDKYLKRRKNRKLARDLFNEYIEGYIDLYGIEYISSNVHNLCHVVDDVIRFGNLSKIGAYPFENCLYGLKLRIRNCNKPLEQVSRRIAELNLNYREPINLLEQNNYGSEPILKYSFDFNGELVYRQILFSKNLLLSSRNFGDKWFLTDRKKVVEFHFSVQRNQEIFLYGSCVGNLNNFFTHPISSEKNNIFSKYDDVASPTEPIMYKLENVMAKTICLRNAGQSIFIPMLHTLN